MEVFNCNVRIEGVDTECEWDEAPVQPNHPRREKRRPQGVRPDMERTLLKGADRGRTVFLRKCQNTPVVDRQFGHNKIKNKIHDERATFQNPPFS